MAPGACRSAIGGANVCGTICCQLGVGLEPAINPCPISRREYKRDIEYLTSEDLGRLHAEVQDIRLASYHYKSETASTPRRLGFIIDDLKSLTCVNPDGNSVDLYAYVSMAVGALQVQDRELKHQARELEELKSEIELLKRSTRK